MGSDENNFNVPLIVKDIFTRQYPQTTTFDEKGEPKRNRIEVLMMMMMMMWSLMSSDVGLT